MREASACYLIGDVAIVVISCRHALPAAFDSDPGLSPDALAQAYLLALARAYQVPEITVTVLTPQAAIRLLAAKGLAEIRPVRRNHGRLSSRCGPNWPTTVPVP
jgi:hypothetical protein